MESNHEVHFASSEQAYHLLRKNFPSLKSYELPAYQVRYGNKGRTFILKILEQAPHIFKTIASEQTALSPIHKDEQFDLIISDNRYGIFQKGAYNIFMTHQLNVLSGIHKSIDQLLYRFHKKRIKQYQEVWIVDHPSKSIALAPRLAHPDRLPSHYHHIGHLSQLTATPLRDAGNTKNQHILALLSGPEPMRSLLLEKIMQQASLLTNYSFTIIAGNHNYKQVSTPAHIRLIPIATSQVIKEELLKCDLVFCRSGYSTVMDLLAIRKNAVLIPTPGQTEQVYLAQRLSSLNYFYSTRQEALDLSNAILKSENYKGFCNYPDTLNNGFKARIKALEKKLGHL